MENKHENTDSRKWYVVYTKPHFEKKVHEQLGKWYGIESWCPVTKSRRQWSDRVKTVEVPLFRGYVFVKVTEKERIQALSLDGAVKYVSYQGKPAIIREGDITGLKEFLEKYREVKVQQLAPGKSVVVKSGLFEGQPGVVKNVLNNNKVILELPQLGCKLEASVDIL